MFLDSPHDMNVLESIDRRDYGRLEGEVAQLRIDVAHLTAQMAMTNTILSEARGGWRTMMMISGFASAAGGAISWMLTHVKLAP